MGKIVYDHFHSLPSQLAVEFQRLALATAGTIVEMAAASMEGQTPPSAPGSAPAIRTGLLHNSLKAEAVSGIGTTFEAIAYTDVEYGQHLEFGTIFMEARPFLRPPAEKIRPVYYDAARRLLRKAGY